MGLCFVGSRADGKEGTATVNVTIPSKADVAKIKKFVAPLKKGANPKKCVIS